MRVLEFINGDFSPGRLFVFIAVALVAGPGCPREVVRESGGAVPQEHIEVGEMAPVVPVRSGRFDKRLVPECSGLVASRKHAGVFWTHSDSGNAATLVPVRADGSVVGKRAVGVRVDNASNIDWEALALDGAGQLIVADVGNNHSNRRNLTLLVLPEPDPWTAQSVRARHIAVRYADQRDFPDRGKRFDCEAVFVWNGAIYALTKRWSDTWTVLYRLRMQDARRGVFEPVTSFDSRGLVTDAGVSPDGRMLAILTYHGLWVFVLPERGVNPLSGSVLFRRLQFPLTSWQAEAVAFVDNENVIIGTEQGDLYALALSRLSKVR
ncbi:MAG: hypothetical protein LBD14_06235 [Puniceicoccales bacterium]|jgi:hypothetical protein|nr:hypothetical protein [Puniceicoccales bacterium]